MADDSYGETWIGRSVCDDWWQNEGFIFHETKTVDRIRLKVKGDDALFIDYIGLDLDTQVCSWCPGTAGMFFDTHHIAQWGVDGGKGWCMGEGSTPGGWSSHCGGGKVKNCFEWRNYRTDVAWYC